MAAFLPLVASPTLTSLGGIAHCVPESNSVDSISLPSGSLSPTLIVMRTPLEGRRNNTCRLLFDGGTHEQACRAVSHPCPAGRAGGRPVSCRLRTRLPPGLVGIPPRLRDAGLGALRRTRRRRAGGRGARSAPGTGGLGHGAEPRARARPWR